MLQCKRNVIADGTDVEPFKRTPLKTNRWLLENQEVAFRLDGHINAKRLREKEGVIF